MDSTLAFAEDRSVTALTLPSRRVAVGSALLALACVLGLVESALPPLVAVPWLRVGLANIAVLVALLLIGTRTAAVVSLGRVGLLGLFTGSLASPAFGISVAGAGCALAAMWLVARHVPGASAVGISAAGSAAHVIGQFVAAAVVLGAPGLLVLAPPSALAALLLGAATGLVAGLTVSRLRDR